MDETGSGINEYIKKLHEAMYRSLGLPTTFFLQDGDLSFVTKIRQEMLHQKYAQMIRIIAK